MCKGQWIDFFFFAGVHLVYLIIALKSINLNM